MMSAIKLPDIPSTKFARYLQQEYKKQNSYGSTGGVFQSVEAEMFAHNASIDQPKAQDIDHEPSHVWLRKEIIERTGTGDGLTLRYKGVLDGRGHPLCPGPAKEGSFWVVEHAGHVGSFEVNEGDILVRFDGFNSNWLRIPNGGLEPPPLKVTQKTKAQLLHDASKVLFPPSKPPATKAAPGPGKRKVILEDE